MYNWLYLIFQIGAIQTGEIHAGIGLENVQCVELEEWKKTRGEDPEDVQLLRRKCHSHECRQISHFPLTCSHP